MKRLMLPFFLLIIFCCFYSNGNAQVWKRIKNEVKNRVENRAVNKSGNAADAAMDETEKAVRGDKDNTDSETEDAAAASNSKAKSNKNSVADYKSYDFVAGDKIIFQPDLSNEPDAELPARFTIHSGNAEIQTYDGEKILHLNKGSHVTVLPLMNSDHYLPEQFTLEFDLMYENEDDYFRYANSFEVGFRQRGDNNFGNYPLYIFSIENGSGEIWGKHGTSMVHFGDALQKSMVKNNAWHHIAIYIRKNIGKVYIDQYRVAASNTMPFQAGFLSLSGDAHYGFKIKNFRLAAGGDDKYQKIVTDGKFITHGIQFDVNKSTIKPESMGAINEIARLLKDHADLKLEIDGYTDNDGNADANKKLSQNRADAVKEKLLAMGIEGERLTTKGFGADKPIDSNDTAEGKANNRRVEFVKM
ncbi:MAG TPA: OmpA family protein [Chitinophagaceae bacterium]